MVGCVFDKCRQFSAIRRIFGIVIIFWDLDGHIPLANKIQLNSRLRDDRTNEVISWIPFIFWFIMSSSSWPDDRKYFLRDEVLLHNRVEDAWVVLQGKVIDVTEIFCQPLSDVSQKQPKRFVTFSFQSLKYLLAFAGKDISHFFDKRGKPKTRITINGTEIPVLPAAFHFTFENIYWWEDPDLVVGYITFRPRKLRIINTLTTRTQLMVVCEEDTLGTIREKYQRYNWHHESYWWKKYDPNLKEYSELCFRKTLTQNGFCYDGDYVPPSIWLFYKDDETVA